MAINRDAVVRLLRDFDFPTLFTQEIGWDRGVGTTQISARDQSFALQAVAEKRGVQVFVCPPDADGRIPPADIRAVIDRETTKLAYEHLLIFTDAAKTEQLWLYPRREPGRPVRLIPYRFDLSTSNEMLLQRLDAISFTLNEEEELTLFEVTDRLKETFDRDKLTKSFYQRFAKERDAFQKFLKGIPDADLARWYVAVLMNRLMFIYFIQEKGFLDGDQRYLQKRLDGFRGNYYRDFLCPLFFQGFALPEDDRPTAAKQMLGRLPYLNGGIFQKHQIEVAHGKTIEIPNKAFAALFTFFDDYRWHLDERPLAEGNEINPDVLGYIFEKYINQKQMGAYYTKEDITEYISKNTIIPFLFDAARRKCRVAFENPDGPTVWGLLRDHPDTYIYPAIRHGLTWDYQPDHPHKGIPLDKSHELPPDIARGVKPPTLYKPVGDGPILTLELRKDWNKAAPRTHALPTETWREVVARRARYEDLQNRLASGAVHDINDLITLNLDIRQFAQDVIEHCEGPDLLRAFWHAIEKVTILDPTCGSGAFLFAALNILEPLYEACLERMEAFLHDEQEKLDVGKRRFSARGYPELPHKKFEDFTRILDRVAAHPNRRYYILKSIILNNLFGVDIMEEAVEICKLRLFLKLAAQVDPDPAKPNFGIEPLPDIDFNIRAGNTLVGFATFEDAKRTITSKLDFDNAMEKIALKAADLQQSFDRFRQRQTEGDGSVPAQHKQELSHRLSTLKSELDRYLATDYGVEPSKKADFAAWLESHRPFHWFVEFYGIMNSGGFDVIIGNPPFVEFTRGKFRYTIRNFLTASCGNLYAFIVEQTINILNPSHGRLTLIMPLSGLSTPRMQPLQKLLDLSFSPLWAVYLSGDANPSRLFEGVKFRLAFVAGKRQSGAARYFCTRYVRWYAEERASLFERLTFGLSNRLPQGTSFRKAGDFLMESVLNRISSLPALGSQFTRTGPHIYYHNCPVNWIRATTFLPRFRSERDGSKTSTQIHQLHFQNAGERNAGCCFINGTVFFLLWLAISDCYHLTSRELRGAHVNLQDLAARFGTALEELNVRLMCDLRLHSKERVYNYRTSGRVVYDEFYPKLSKPIIDQIDCILARHYGFTEEELDFIINYDIKYRMGRHAVADGK